MKWSCYLKAKTNKYAGPILEHGMQIFFKKASKTPKRANQERKYINDEKLKKYIDVLYMFFKKDTLLCDSCTQEWSSLGPKHVWKPLYR